METSVGAWCPEYLDAVKAASPSESEKGKKSKPKTQEKKPTKHYKCVQRQIGFWKENFGDPKDAPTEEQEMIEVGAMWESVRVECDKYDKPNPYLPD